MDLLLKSIIAMVVIIGIIFVAYFAISSTHTEYLTRSEAVSQVVDYLQNSNQGAVVNITNATESTSPGSWDVVATVITNATKQCPSYLAYYFDYPRYGFVNGTQTIYTSGCKVYGYNKSRTYIIGSYPVAITMVHLLNLSVVNKFSGEYGANVVVSAYYNKTSNVGGQEYNNTWTIRYSAPEASNSLYIVISQLNGTYIASYNST